jgi:uncharacterized membrane protein YfcA
MSTIQLNHYFVMPLCAVMVGLDKGGIPGLAALGMTVLVSGHPEGGVSHVIATFVPILLVADLGACMVYRDAVDWGLIKIVLIPMILGIFAGVATIGVLDDNHVKKIVGFALLLITAMNFIAKCTAARKRPVDSSILPLISKEKLLIAESSGLEGRRPSGDAESISMMRIPITKRRGGMLAALGCGFLTGILTMVANVAGPIVTAYFLSLDIHKRELNATRAYLFLIANLVKIPVQIFLGNLVFADVILVTVLILIALISTLLAERYIISFIDQKTFEFICWALVVIGALKLLIDSSIQS